jgi:hypothetical protein
VERFELDLALPSGGIAGRVLAPDGAPLEGAAVRVARESGNIDLSSMDGGDTAWTDDEGRFRFELLRSGEYRLRVEPQSRELGRASLGSVAVADGRVTENVEIRLGGSGNVAVVVRDAASAAAAARIFVRDASGTLVEEVSTHATGEEGEVEIAGLAPGSYTVCARGEHSASDEVSVDVAEKGSARVELVLGDAAWLVVSTIDADGASVRAEVEVADEEGRAVHRMLGREAMEEALLGGFSSTTRRFGPLPLGRYRVVATTADGRSDKATVTLRSAGAERALEMRVK